MSKEVIFVAESSTTPLRVDREKGVIYDVRVTGLRSKNRRAYKEPALQAAQPLYEGAVVCMDHAASVRRNNPPGGLRDAPADAVNRDMTDRLGRLEGIYHKPGDGLYAKELQCDLNHPYAKSLLFWAEKDPSKIVLSHAVSGDYYHDRTNDLYVFNSIDKVHGVDIVAKGGTNRTLFENEPEMNENEDLGIFLRSLFPGNAPVADIKTAVSGAIKLSADTPREFKGTVAEALSALQATPDARVRLVVESLDAKLVKERADAIRSKAKQACVDAKLPEASITDIFVESLTRDAEDRWNSLIEDRRKLGDGKSEAPRTLGTEAGKITLEQFCSNVRAGK